MASSSTSAPIGKEESQSSKDTLFIQQQMSMDSATLDKLLMAEQNLLQAGEATLQAWRLIGRDPSEEEKRAEASKGFLSSSSVNDDDDRDEDEEFEVEIDEDFIVRKDRTEKHNSDENDCDFDQNHKSDAMISKFVNDCQGSMSSSFLFPSHGNKAKQEGNGNFAMEIPRMETRVSNTMMGDTSKQNVDGMESHLMDRMASSRSDSSNFTGNRGPIQHSISGNTSETRAGLTTGNSNLFGFNTRDVASFGTLRTEMMSPFTFTVRKADSVFEKLGSKKASMQIQIDVEARILSFMIPQESRETYSCAAITAKPYSKFGLHLKIQTGNASVNRKVNFYSVDDRKLFQEVLEQGKVMLKRNTCGVTESPASVTSVSATYGASDGVMRSRLQETLIKDPITLLDGETVLEHVQRVTNLVVMSQNDRAVQGVLKITTYRVTFSPYDSAWKFGSFELPLAAIDLITRDGLMLLIACKDLRTIRLAMHDAYSRKKGYDQPPSNPDIRWLNLLTLRMKPPTQINSLFAFDYHAEKSKHRKSGINRREDGWLVYSPVTEYQRLGFLRHQGSATLRQQTSCSSESREIITWRLLKNSKFRFSPTYPQLMVVPSKMSEDELVQSARFRSRARLPVVVWRHPVNKSVLARSSQPNYGMAGNRSESDRILLKAYRDSANANSAGISPPLHILDARKPIATKGNRLKGKGVENSQHYDNATVEFLGIANIHKMRDSLDALKLLVSPSSIEDGDKHYHNRLENTRWLKHVMRVLSGARRVAEVLHEVGASVLVHCSDGWDRTPQLVALAQLILDPYYRTIRGFSILIEKEWCSFGHKFADRVGVGKDITDQPNERSPVMLQFLDCVWQMARQFPSCFEFNEKFLLHIADALISGLFGTFLYNSERERIFEKIWERTESVWTPILESSVPYLNPMYKHTNRVLYPRANLKRVVLWDAMYFRWDPESHPDYVEFMEMVVPGEEALHEAVIDQVSNVSEAGNVYTEDLDTEESAMRLEVEGIHDYDEYRTKSVFSDCSDMSDDDASTLINERAECINVDDPNETEEQATCISLIVDLSDVDHSMVERYRRGAEERTRQRSQGRNIREALQMAPDQSRIKYLEQLLSESVARELQLEAELDSLHAKIVDHRAILTPHSDSKSGIFGQE
uniref:Myotubularinlike protein putative n=1 Tax=Albugo laibachii Nc14 TaxID=890382 RepID=F0W0A5_9STRA|nr:myotubularinlike protein putative [Albugo laibachii Nc14]|eukprot:CCA14476.1 myotubularinlike protein putative [Albugo laibachii Nc14]